jgi:hypothetical protein
VHGVVPLVAHDSACMVQDLARSCGDVGRTVETGGDEDEGSAARFALISDRLNRSLNARDAVGARCLALLVGERIEAGAARPARPQTCSMLCIPARRITSNASGPTPRRGCVRCPTLSNLMGWKKSTRSPSRGTFGHWRVQVDAGARTLGSLSCCGPALCRCTRVLHVCVGEWECGGCE